MRPWQAGFVLRHPRTGHPVHIWTDGEVIVVDVMDPALQRHGGPEYHVGGRDHGTILVTAPAGRALRVVVCLGCFLHAHPGMRLPMATLAFFARLHGRAPARSGGGVTGEQLAAW